MIKKAQHFSLLLLVFVLPIQLGSFFFHDFSFINGVRVDYLAPALYLSDILVFLCVVLFAKPLFVRIRYDILFHLFFLLLFLHSFTAHIPAIAIYKTVKLYELYIVFRLFQIVKTPMEHIGTAFAFSTITQLILAILQFVNKHAIQGIFYYLGERALNLSTPDVAKISIQGAEFLRAYGSFSHPNSLAGFYLISYIFFLFRKDRLSPLIRILILTSTSILVLLSFSKTAIAIWIVISIYYAVKTKGFRCIPCLLSSLLTVLVPALIFLQGTGDTETIAKRLYLLLSSIALFHDSPLIGYGLGNYPAMQATLPSPYPFFFFQPVHNIFVLYFVEVGSIIAIFTAVLIIPKLWKWRTIHGMIPVLVVIFITGMVDHYWLTLQQNMLIIPVIFGLLTRKTHA